MNQDLLDNIQSPFKVQCKYNKTLKKTEPFLCPDSCVLFSVKNFCFFLDMHKKSRKVPRGPTVFCYNMECYKNYSLDTATLAFAMARTTREAPVAQSPTA